MGTLIALDDDLIWVNNGGSSPTPPEPDIPDGTTAIPINDVVIWQKCAGLTQQYDTLAEVLADSGIVRTLMNSKNAVDYLVRSTGFAKSQALVPTMTGNTTPSGECFANQPASSGYDYFKAFDGDSTTFYFSTQLPQVGTEIGYMFASPVKVNRLYYQDNIAASQIKLQGSNDGTTYSDIATEINVTNTIADVNFENNNTYKYYKVVITQKGSGSNNTAVYTLQFYSEAGITESSTAMTYIGTNDYASDTLLADPTWSAAINASTYWQSVMNGKAPIMTSNTTPSGQCICDGTGIQTGAAWTLFDGSTSTPLYEYGTHTKYFGYIFTDNVLIRKFYIYQHYPYAITSARLDGYTGSAWEAITTLSLDTTTSTLSVETNKEYKGFRIVQLAGVHAQATYLYELQFYGRCNGGVQSWLTAGGVTDKNYTTLSQVLNDPVTLQALMQSENAVNYLVTCKMWINEICSNENAMTYIGYSNYASNTLLADSTWNNAIQNSAYFESIDNVKVPIMTSNNTPSGQVSSSGSSLYEGQLWYVFNPNQGAIKFTGAPSSAYIIYDFGYDVTFLKASAYIESVGTLGKVDTSADGNTWTECGDFNNTSATQTINLTPSKNRYVRINVKTKSGVQAYAGVNNIQFWGRVDI